MRLFALYLLFISMAVAGRIVEADDYTPGDFHSYTHASGNVPEDVYQYSVYVPADYDPGKSYPLVFYLHGGGEGRVPLNKVRENVVSDRLVDNKRATDAGYTRHAPGFIGYILVTPVKYAAIWNPAIFGRLYDHVKRRVSIDENRVYVTGLSMGGQGAWRIACGNLGSYNIAAMMPYGAWGCDDVERGTTPETCKTTKTAVWVLHCPLDHVSKISEQLTIFQSHLDCGGYGRFTMIPGKGHICRPPNDYAFFSMRMGWMLAQTFGTPFNYVVKVNDGTIAKVAQGKRPYTGDNSRFGFYEPGTVLNITAPKAKNGKSFVKWASVKGTFDDASSRSTSYTTPPGDVVISAIYGMQPYSLNVTGGTTDPVAPLPGQVVTVTADAKKDEEKFAYWTTSTDAVDIAVPSVRSFQFVVPSEHVTLTVQGVAKDSVDYEALERELEKAVVEGKLTEEEAKAKWAEIMKKDKANKDEAVDYRAIGERLEAAVAEGKLTEEEAKAKWKAIRKKTEDSH